LFITNKILYAEDSKFENQQIEIELTRDLVIVNINYCRKCGKILFLKNKKYNSTATAIEKINKLVKQT
jgi:hypothetical protein